MVCTSDITAAYYYCTFKCVMLKYDEKCLLATTYVIAASFTDISASHSIEIDRIAEFFKNCFTE